MRATAVLVFATSLFAAAKCQQSGAIRLYNGDYSDTLTSGIVEVFLNGAWQTICRYNSAGVLTWGLYEAEVACHQLGYTGASSSDATFGTDSNPVGISGVDCSLSSYLVLLQCSYDTGSVDYCSSNSDQATVSCYSSLLTDSPFTGMVRLQGGAYVTTGRAEVYCNGQWGTLCDSTSFTSNVAETVCYQLGYNDYVSYTSGVNPGSSSQPIWMNNYDCYSAYACISACQTCPASNITSCQHSQDVSVTCEYETTFGNYGSTLYTCSLYWTAGLIVGVIFAILGGFALCLCLFVGIPICICCCLGVGIGSAVGVGRNRHHYDTV